MSYRRCSWYTFALALLVLTVLTCLPALADDAPLLVIRDVELSAPVTPVAWNGDVRDLPAPREWKPGDPVKEIPMRFYPPPGAGTLAPDKLGTDPLLHFQQDILSETGITANTFTVPNRNFAGQGYTGVNPPDTVGDVGPDHYIQMINAAGGAIVRIWDKGEPVPALLSTFALDTLGSGNCASGKGDPIVLYDRQAERWLLTEFANSGNHLCVFVSQTPDPLSGGWNNYDFSTPTFPDYPKYAVWGTDANGGQGSYLVTANDGGPGVYGLDRGAMLSGAAATYQKLTMPDLPGFSIQGPAPADPDGPLSPPSGSPAYILRHRDTELHFGPTAPGDLIEMWQFDVDWTTPSNTTLTQATSIDVSEFDSTVCGTAFAGCFPQPSSGTTLMPIREVIMNRVQYYNHEDIETLVGSFVVDADGTDHGGVRWFELQRPLGGNWDLYQEGTYAIDDDHRWMPSIAMDQSGNIALGYNITSSVTFPSLRYTGRLADDPLGVMTQPESVMHAGSGSNSSIRYGDYASMNLDPTDDCTFWFTGMDNASSNWRTQVTSYRFDICGCQLAPLSPVIDASVSVDNQIDLFWADSELDTVTEYRVQRSRTQGGPYTTITTITDSTPGFVGGAGYLFEDTDVSGDITYYYVVIADDGDTCRSVLDNEVAVLASGSCTLRPIFVGLQSATSAVFESCTVDLAWDTAMTECGGPAMYNVYRSTTPAFSPGPGNLLVSGLMGTGTTDINALADATSYHYQVRAVDAANGIADTNTLELSVLSTGTNTGLQSVFFDDFEDPGTFGDWTILTGPGPHRCGDWERASATTQRPSGGSGNYALSLSRECINLLPQTSTSLDSPAVNLDMAGIQSVTLEVDLYYNHFDGDDATLEVWDGSSWQVIWADANADVNSHLVIDVSAEAIGNAAFQMRFNYQNANNDWWYAVDNVDLIADIWVPCSTAAAPPSAPGGQGTTAQLTAERLTVTGDLIDVNWDASCGADQYNLLYGDLSTVSTATLSGSECSIGSSGNFSWSAVPTGGVYFLIVGSDGSAIESSWGEGTSGERNGLDPSLECNVTAKNISNVCQ